MSISSRYASALCLGSLALLFAFLPTDCVAAPTSPLMKFRGEYFRLRNVDPTGDDPVHFRSWESLLSRIREIVARGGGSEDLPALRV